MKLTKALIYLWVSQMVANPDLIADGRVTSDLIGRASSGEMDALRDLLRIYRDHIDTPKAPTYFNIAPDALDNRIRAVLKPLPLAQRRDSLDEVLVAIENGQLEIF